MHLLGKGQRVLWIFLKQLLNEAEYDVKNFAV